jgi:hypothetical protein
MSLVQTVTLNAGLIVEDAVIKITGLEYDEAKRTARIRVEIYKDITTSREHNSVSLQTNYYDLPEWDKSTPGNTFNVAYGWLVAYVYQNGVSDEVWEAAQNQPDEVDGYVIPEEQDGYLN